VPPLIALAIGISGLALWVPAFITLMWIRRRQQG